LVPHQENLRLDFEEGLIYIEGPPEEVLQAKQKLSKEITRLGNEFCSEVMHVAPSLHRHIIGKSGSVGLFFILGDCFVVFLVFIIKGTMKYTP